MAKYFIKTYGCQMNYSDSERIAGVLELAGYKKISQESEADLIVINMCSVRKSAVDRIAGNFKKYKQYKKKNPNLKIVLTGCVLESDKERFEKLFDVVETRHCLVSTAKPLYQSKITAYVPIMTGCNNFCSYCVVPYTRGREYSRSVKEIIGEITELVNNKYKEIILLGQNVNSYSPDDNTNFPKLLKLINNISGDFWIRFLTSHPKDVTEELIKTIAQCDKCTENIHLALQSGNDDILKKMNRKYTVKHFLDLIKMIRKYISNVAITTDIIVGFPTETEKQFQNTVKVMKKAKFDMAYINKYSPRAGTASAKLEDNVSWQEKKRREKVLTEILKETALENNQKYIGKVVEVLIDKVDNEFIYGKTRSFKNVRIRIMNYESRIEEGEFVEVKIIEAKFWNLEGEVVE